MRRHSLFAFAALLLSIGLLGHATAADKAPTLTAEDKKFLEGLMKDFLFDPKGAERVTFKMIGPSIWGLKNEEPAEGWLVPGRDGNAARVYFADGHSIVASTAKEMTKVDFVSACRVFYVPSPRKEFEDRVEEYLTKQKMGAGAVESGTNSLALAAWLYRFGQESLAAQALADARDGVKDLRDQLRVSLVKAIAKDMLDLFLVRADVEAFTCAERILRICPEPGKYSELSDTAQLVDQIKRRKKKDTFGKKPPEKRPEGFASWSVKQKAAYLIEMLEEVDVRMSGIGVRIESDSRVQELIRLGEAAVPSLLDALEKDERLTHSWSHPIPTLQLYVINVREAAETALFGILKVSDFDPFQHDTHRHGEDWNSPKKRAERARAYWEKFGHLPFDERMMKVLTDPRMTGSAKQQAMRNLARIDSSSFSSPFILETFNPSPPRQVNPVVAKFKNPTVAEAIMNQLDAELKAFDERIPKKILKYNLFMRRGTEQLYLSTLVELGDTRIAKVVAERASLATEPDVRRIWGEAAHHLGEKAVFKSFIDDFRQGKLGRFDDEEGAKELIKTMSAMIRVNTPEANDALVALAEPNHPLAKLVASQIADQHFAHPYCLLILRRALDDTAPTGATIVVEGNDIFWRGGRRHFPQSISDFFADTSMRRDQVPERACDIAAEQISKLVGGLPTYHPLFKDADKRLDRFKAAFDRFAGNYRRATNLEAIVLNLYTWEHAAYLPDIRSAGHAATAADVKAGKAIFHLDGQGKPAKLELPAVAELQAEMSKDKPARLLILQAEVGPDGETTYGVVTTGAVRTATALELTNIRSLAQFEKEQQEAAEKARDGKD